MAYNDLKLNKKYKYIIYKLSDDNKQIVIDSTSEDGADYEDFREKLINAKTKSKTVRFSCLVQSLERRSLIDDVFVSRAGRRWQGSPLCRLRLRVRAGVGRGYPVGLLWRAVDAARLGEMA